MRHQERVAMLLRSGRATLRRALPRLPWRRVAWVAAAFVVAAGTMVASAERDAYLRTHPRVPDVVGKTVAEAARMMVPLHFGVMVVRSLQDPHAAVGIVLAQNPAPGRLRPMGSVIQLKVSQGSGVVPHLRGDPVHEAARRLERVGLRLGQVRGIEDDADPGTVLEQFTPPGQRVDANGSVDVLISQGPGGPAALPARAAATIPPLTLPSAPGPPSRTPSSAVPLTATPSVGPGSGTVVLGPDHRELAPQERRREPVMPRERQEGGPRVGSAPIDCAAHAERKRAEVCHQPADNRGTKPDLHGSEHRDVPPGP
jgi:hypothetical protein